MPGIHREAVFGGLDVKYEARVDEIVVPDSSGEPGARYVCTSYTVPGASERPVIFAFNGGPGSSSVWLHLGIGPRRVADADLLRPRMAPPFGLADNPDCVLDSADLVFIDPPGTGFSRVLDEERQADFYGVVPDAIATMRFITQWSRRHGRENSPKFLLGESYGAIRAATVAKLSAGGPTTTGRLESLALNGVILMGPGLQFGNGANLAHVTTLPSLAATAWYHDRLPGRPADVREHVEAATRFAEEDYLTALFAGFRLDRRRREAVAARLHELIGLAPGVIAEHDLRLTPQRFASLLLRDQGEQVGLYDSRYRLPLAGAGGDPVADDPAMGQYVPSFAGAIDGYLREELGVERDDDYRTIEFARVNFRWDYGDGARLPAGNYAADLAVALRRNRDLRVLLCVGMYDLVTTLGETNYALSQAPIDPERVSVRTYESGHMPYLGRESRERLAADLRAVVKAPAGEEPPCVSQ
ncbi:hypothetical protein [Nonomuraea sp. NPDC049625]|uniref:S10 family peptidase n=1 Tax=Nonomuraea sp. NPDC049625 TaxID=3155775 RepID=UPI003420526D